MLKSQTKVIVRNLPKTLTSDQFLQDIEKFNYRYNYFRFYGMDKNSKSLSTRAYINFYNEDDMYEFKNNLENKPFFDEFGNETYCIVEFAVYQRIPGKSKIDSKQKTISSDPEFIKFAEELKEPHKSHNIGTVESNLEEIKNKETEKLNIKTPLIEFLSNIPKKEKSKKEEYRRKGDYGKSFSKKDLENNELKNNNKIEPVIAKKNVTKEISNDLISKNEISKGRSNEKLDIKKTKPSQRNDIKTYAAAYEDYEIERGFENKSYRGGRIGGYEGEEKVYYYSNRNPEPYYGGRNYNYGGGYSDYSSGHGSYSRAPSMKNKRGGGRRPPAYSATRKD